MTVLRSQIVRIPQLEELGDRVPVVIIRPSDAGSLAAMDTATDESVPVIVMAKRVDELASPVIEAVETLWASSRRVAVILSAPVPLPGDRLRAAAVIAGRRDVVSIRDCRGLPDGWLATLLDAAYRDGKTASASALCQCNLPRGAAAPTAEPVHTEPARVPEHGRKCVYWRREALELLGSLDDIALGAKDPGRWVRDFGMHHVAATGLVVQCDRRVADGMPADMHGSSFSEDERTRFAAALGQVRRGDGPKRVLLDARSLSGPLSGTSILTAQVGRALMALDGDVELTWWQPMPTSDAVAEHLQGMKLESRRELAGERFDVVFRPHQVPGRHELETLLSAGDRLVVLQLDTIAFENSSYFPDVDAWARNREGSALAAFCADHVCFLTQAARRDAIAEGLITADTPTTVIGCGIDHADARERPASARLSDLARGPFLLCLGASFFHKNRLSALRAFAELIATGWNGSLVLAGSRPTDGSSSEIEERILGESPELRARTCDLGPVTEDEKWWLLRSASLVLSTAISEGFGMVPFEAALVGTPSLASRVGALPELLPAWGGYLDSFDPRDVASQVMSTLASEMRVRQLVEPLVRVAEAATWHAVALRLNDVFEEVLAGPRTRRAGLFVGSLGLRPSGEAVVATPRAISSEFAAALDALDRRPWLSRPLTAFYRLVRDAKLAQGRR